MQKINLEELTDSPKPQHTLTIGLGGGEDGKARRLAYERAALAANKSLGQWIRDILDSYLTCSKNP